jgi:hypothetical protein
VSPKRRARSPRRRSSGCGKCSTTYPEASDFDAHWGGRLVFRRFNCLPFLLWSRSSSPTSACRGAIELRPGSSLGRNVLRFRYEKEADPDCSY